MAHPQLNSFRVKPPPPGYVLNCFLFRHNSGHGIINRLVVTSGSVRSKESEGIELYPKQNKINLQREKCIPFGDKTPGCTSEQHNPTEVDRFKEKVGADQKLYRKLQIVFLASHKIQTFKFVTL